MLIAVNYHYIRPQFDSPYPAIFGLTPDQFKTQLCLLGSIGRFASAEQIRNAVHGGKLDERSIVITFDDGLREQFEYAWPILKSLGIPAIFFVNTAPIVEEKVLTVHQIHLLRSQLAPETFQTLLSQAAEELGVDIEIGTDDAQIRAQYHYDSIEAARIKYILNFKLGWRERETLIRRCFQSCFPGREAEISRKLYMPIEQIQELSQEGCLGNHTHDHLPVGLLPEDKAADEVSLANRLLADWTGCPPYALSYPYGSKEVCSGQACRSAMDSGIDFAFTMERAGNLDLAFPLHLARIDNNDAPGGKASRWSTANLFESLPASSWGSAISNDIQSHDRTSHWQRAATQICSATTGANHSPDWNRERSKVASGSAD